MVATTTTAAPYTTDSSSTTAETVDSIAEVNAASLLNDNVSIIDCFSAISINDDVISTHDAIDQRRVQCEACYWQWRSQRVEFLQKTVRQLKQIRQVAVAANSGENATKVTQWLYTQLNALFMCVCIVLDDSVSPSAFDHAMSGSGNGSSDCFIGWLDKQLFSINHQMSLVSCSISEPKPSCECTCDSEYRVVSVNNNHQTPTKLHRLYTRLHSASKHQQASSQQGQEQEEKRLSENKVITNGARKPVKEASGLRGLLAALSETDHLATVRLLTTLSGSAQGRESLRRAKCHQLLIKLSHVITADQSQLVVDERQLRLRTAAFSALEAVLVADCDTSNDSTMASPQNKAVTSFERLFELMKRLRMFSERYLQLAPSIDEAEHPLACVVSLLQLSCDEHSRDRLRKAGAVSTLAELFVIDTEKHGNTCLQSSPRIGKGSQSGNEGCTTSGNGGNTGRGCSADCLTMRRLIAMTLTNLTYGQPSLRSELCSLKPFLSSVVAQLTDSSISELIVSHRQLLQAVACLLRNLSWRAGSLVRQRLRHSGAASALARAAMAVCVRSADIADDDDEKNCHDQVLSAVLSALWNMTGHCVGSRSLLCAERGWLAFLIETVRLKGNSVGAKGGVSSVAREVLENSTGVLRNLCGEAVLSPAGRRELVTGRCGSVLVPLLAIPQQSHTVLHNVCATLCSLAAAAAMCSSGSSGGRIGGMSSERSRDSDRKQLVTTWRATALPLLHVLTDSNHRSVAVASVVTLRYLLSGGGDCSPVGGGGVCSAVIANGSDITPTAVVNGIVSDTVCREDGVAAGTDSSGSLETPGLDRVQIPALLQTMATRYRVSVDSLCARLSAYLSTEHVRSDNEVTDDIRDETLRVSVDSNRASFTAAAGSSDDQPTDYGARYGSGENACTTGANRGRARMVRFISSADCHRQHQRHLSSSERVNNNNDNNSSGGEEKEDGLDKPTDFGARYAEHPGDTHAHHHQEQCVADSVHTYATEGTPAVGTPHSLSTTSSLLQLCPEPGGPEGGPATVAGTGVATVNETPLVFSRSGSSLGSLEDGTARDLDGADGDHNSVVSSIYSRPVSGPMSPSEVPDSPSQLAGQQVPVEPAQARPPAQGGMVGDDDGDSDDDEMIYACIRSAMPTGRGRGRSAASHSSTSVSAAAAESAAPPGGASRSPGPDRTCNDSADCTNDDDDDALLDRMIGEVMRQQTTASASRDTNCPAVSTTATKAAAGVNRARSGGDQMRLYAVEDTPVQFSTATSLSDLTMDDAVSTGGFRQVQVSSVSAAGMCKRSADISRVYATEDTPAVFSRCDSLSDICPREEQEGAGQLRCQEVVGDGDKNNNNSRGCAEVGESNEGEREGDDGSETDDMLLERCINSAMPKSRSQSRQKRLHHHHTTPRQSRVSNHRHHHNHHHHTHRSHHQQQRQQQQHKTTLLDSVVADRDGSATITTATVVSNTKPAEPTPSIGMQSNELLISRGPRIVKPQPQQQQSVIGSSSAESKAVRGRRKSLYPGAAPRSTRTTQLRRVVSAPLDDPMGPGPYGGGGGGAHGSAPASCANSPRPALRRFGSTGKAGVVLTKSRQRFSPVCGGGGKSRVESAAPVPAPLFKQDTFTVSVASYNSAKSLPVSVVANSQPIRSPSKFGGNRIGKQIGPQGVPKAVSPPSRTSVSHQAHETRARSATRSLASGSNPADVSSAANRSTSLHNRRHRVIITHL